MKTILHQQSGRHHFSDRPLLDLSGQVSFKGLKPQAAWVKRRTDLAADTCSVIAELAGFGPRSR